MNYANIKNVRTYEEFIYLIGLSNVPPEVQKHVISVLDTHIDNTVGDVHDTYILYISELLSAVGDLCMDLIAVDGRASERKQRYKIAYEDFANKVKLSLPDDNGATVSTKQFIHRIKTGIEQR